MEDEQRKRQKRCEAGRKAVETKGEKELKRAGQMAAWTKKYGKDDDKNPYSKQNYYRHRPQDEDGSTEDAS